MGRKIPTEIYIRIGHKYKNSNDDDDEEEDSNSNRQLNTKEKSLGWWNSNRNRIVVIPKEIFNRIVIKYELVG